MITDAEDTDDIKLLRFGIIDRERVNVNCSCIYSVARAQLSRIPWSERGKARAQAVALSHPVRRLPGHPPHAPVTTHTHSLPNTTGVQHVAARIFNRTVSLPNRFAQLELYF